MMYISICNNVKLFGCLFIGDFTREIAFVYLGVFARFGGSIS